MMNRDLFLANLAMDAYNRGYGAGIDNLPEEGKLGEATILTTTTQGGWQAAGFYAIAYELPDIAFASAYDGAFRGEAAART